jgi:outer membrane protein assembly factor BamD
MKSPFTPKPVKAVGVFACSWLIAALLIGCSGIEKDATAKWDADRLYKEAREELDGGAYAKARENLEKLESRYPFGRYAQQAQVEIAYTYYKENEPAQAITAVDRFLKLQPNHPYAAYALYIKGLANFIDAPPFMGALVDYNVGERDPKALKESFDAFKELVTRFPDSKYAEDSRRRMAFLVNALADGDVAVARFYFRRGAYIAAIQRSQDALRQYPNAPALKDALVLLVLSYEALGLSDLRSDAKRVLDQNFPGTKIAPPG